VLFPAILIFILFVFSFAGCNDKKVRVETAPIPTSTPLPHIEKIIFTSNGNLFWMDPDGNGREEIFPDTNSKWFPAVSNDGFYIAYWVQNNKNYNLWVGDLRSKKAYPVTFDDDLIDNDTQNFNFKNSVCFTVDSNNIIFSRRGEIWQMTRDGYDLVALTDTHNCLSPAVSKNDKLVYVIRENENTYNLYMKDRTAIQPEKLTNFVNKKAGSPSFSPDGKRIVFTVTEGESNNIYSIDITTKIASAITTDGKSNAPSYSPDGAAIVYSCSRNDKYMPSIWMMKAATNEIKPLSPLGGTSPVWLYQILAAALPTYTPTVAPVAMKQEKLFDVKEGAASKTTTAALTVTAGLYVSNDNAPFNPEALKVKTIQQGDKLLFYPVIHYDSALSNIKPEFRTALDGMAEILKTSKSPIVIEGHTDSDLIRTKKFRSNYELSLARAESVKTYLVQIHGIESSRISITGFADSKPLVPNDSNENKYRNRRAEVMVIKVVSDTQEPAATAASVPVIVSKTAKGPLTLSTPAAVTFTAIETPQIVSSPVILPAAPPVKVETKGRTNKLIGW
jgi:chemotaxis protein MotB